MQKQDKNSNRKTRKEHAGDIPNLSLFQLLQLRWAWARAKYKPQSAPAPTPLSLEHIDLVRERARHRLIGGSALVLAGAVGVSFLLNVNERTGPGYVGIKKYGKNNVKPSVSSASPEFPEKTKVVFKRKKKREN